MCLLTIHISFFAKCLFNSFAKFYTLGCHFIANLYSCVMHICINALWMGVLPLISDQFDLRTEVLLLLVGISYTSSVGHANVHI